MRDEGVYENIVVAFFFRYLFISARVSGRTDVPEQAEQTLAVLYLASGRIEIPDSADLYAYGDRISVSGRGAGHDGKKGGGCAGGRGWKSR